MHTVPLFLYVRRGAPDLLAQAQSFKIPHWMLVSYTDPPPLRLLPCHLTEAPATAFASRIGGALTTPRCMPAFDRFQRIPSTACSSAATMDHAACSSRECESAWSDSTSHRQHLYTYPDLCGTEARTSSYAKSHDPDFRGAEACALSCPPSVPPHMREESRSGEVAMWPKAVVAATQQAGHGRPFETSPIASHVPVRKSEGMREACFPISARSENELSFVSIVASRSSASVPTGSPCPLLSSRARLEVMPSQLRSCLFDGLVDTQEIRSSSSNLGVPDGQVRGRDKSSGFASMVIVPASMRLTGLNPFSFHVAADAQALKDMSHNSYARRRWLHVNQISEQSEGATDGGLEGEICKEVYSNSSVLQQLEHQWTSLSEPAVLPLTTDPTSEHVQARVSQTIPLALRQLRFSSQVMQTHQSAESSWWRLDVPRQEEVQGRRVACSPGCHPSVLLMPMPSMVSWFGSFRVFRTIVP